MNMSAGADSATRPVEEIAERDLDVLAAIQANPTRVRQRDIARALGMSLGMTNSLLRRLTQKGLLKIRRSNARNIQYAVSPQGVEAVARRSYRYLRRTLGNVVRYKEQVAHMLEEAKEHGYQKVALVGESDLEFIVEHFAGRLGLRLLRCDDLGEDRDTLWLMSEVHGSVPRGAGDDRANVRSLRHELMELAL